MRKFLCFLPYCLVLGLLTYCSKPFDPTNPACTNCYGDVVFYTDFDAGGDVSISINSDYVGKISRNTGHTAAPPDCYDSYTCSKNLAAGTYTYKATINGNT